MNIQIRRKEKNIIKFIYFSKYLYIVPLFVICKGLQNLLLHATNKLIIYFHKTTLLI